MREPRIVYEIRKNIALTPRSFLDILALWPCVLVRQQFQLVGEEFAALNRLTRCNSALQSNLFLDVEDGHPRTLASSMSALQIFSDLVKTAHILKGSYP